MKNIGIMTFHRAHNYGALLQAFALQTMLEKKYNCFFLDYYNDKVYRQYNILKPLGKNIFKWPKRLFNNVINYNVRVKRYSSFKCFIDNNLRIKPFDVGVINTCDALITGSDQVWNPQITGDLIDEYTLNFGNLNIKRISYAASCGSRQTVLDYEKLIQIKLSNLNHISIREESYLSDFKQLLDRKDISVVLDPTLLLDFNQWNSCISSIENNINEKYILAYVVEDDKDFLNIANEISKKTGLKIIHFAKDNPGYNNLLGTFYTKGPLEFVDLIKNAEYVVTTSFHCTVFSILFNKKFWVVPHKETGSRVTDLLSKLKISNRVVNSFEEFNKKNYDELIKYKEVNKQLAVERKKSLDWLINAIEK